MATMELTKNIDRVQNLDSVKIKNEINSNRTEIAAKIKQILNISDDLDKPTLNLDFKREEKLAKYFGLSEVEIKELEKDYELPLTVDSVMNQAKNYWEYKNLLKKAA